MESLVLRPTTYASKISSKFRSLTAKLDAFTAQDSDRALRVFDRDRRPVAFDSFIQNAEFAAMRDECIPRQN